MFFLALATDYDGTIANHGAVDERTRSALRRLKLTGRRLILVTGRELADLERAFPDLEMFDIVVAENGAVVYVPTSRHRTLLAPLPPLEFIARLIERKVEPISVGHCIVATWEPHQIAVLETIQELGLELKIVFNKGAVMVLPASVTKASGLEAALTSLGMSPHNLVGVGDAENDHAFLQACGCAAAVANALPGVKAAADVTLSGDHGKGVGELIARLIEDEESLMPPRRLGLPIGTDREGNTVHLMPHHNVLVVGDSACGKSRFARMLTEKMVEKRFEFCVIDPEGDYDGLQHSVAIVEAAAVPRWEEALALLGQTGANVVINTVALDQGGRKQLISELLGPISELKVRTGRPHWLIFDEAHQAFPAGGESGVALPSSLPASVFIAVSPESIADEVLSRIDVVIAFGSAAAGRVARLGSVAGFFAPSPDLTPDDEVLVWFRSEGGQPRAVKIDAPLQFHRRHAGKYAVGDVGSEHSFYFRRATNGPSTRARNVFEFVRLSRQLDDATWEGHLRRNDYSAWFRNVIRDEELAHEARQIEDDRQLAPHDSRAKIASLVLSRYAAPVH